MCRWDADVLNYDPTGQECVCFALPDSDADTGLSDGMTVRLEGFG